MIPGPAPVITIHSTAASSRARLTVCRYSGSTGWVRAEPKIAAFRARLGRPVKSRRTKKVYGITDLGRQRLRQLLLDDTTDDRTFSVQVAFCHTLLPEQRVALFERRKAELDRRLVERTRVSGAGTDTYRRSLREHDTQTITHDLAWIDELIGAARAEFAASTEPEPQLNAPHLTAPSPRKEGTHS